MEELIVFLIVILIIFASTKIIARSKKIEEEKEKASWENEQKNLKTIEDNYEHLIDNEDTQTTFAYKNIVHGGSLNHSNWSFENTLKFIAQHWLKRKHLDIQKYAFKKISKDINSKEIFTNKIENIARKTEINPDEVKSENHGL